MVAPVPPPAAKDGVTIVVFWGDFDRVQAAFNIAVGAASSPGPVLMRRLMGRFRVPAVHQMVEVAHSLDAGVATYLADARGSDVNLFI